MTIRLQPAEIEWDEQGQPLSPLFDDLYFSRSDGVGETEHVFLEGNNLPSRWRSLPENTTFTIAETGFGSGLNFLVAVALWKKIRSEGALNNCRLHFISSELYPLRLDDLEKVHTLFPELAEFAQSLQRHYPHLFPGYHRLKIADDITLDLMFGDTVEMYQQRLPTLHQEFIRHRHWQVDAWFLDGFAPARNPLMWRSELFQLMADLSGDGTTIATFTAAGDVRRGLQQTGFGVQKVAGFGSKREMMIGEFNNIAEDPSSSPLPHRSDKSWAIWHLDENAPAEPGDRQATVVGAGISGVLTARKLAERGWTVTILDAGDRPAAAASGNSQVAIYAKLSAKTGVLAEFVETALDYAQREYQPFWDRNIGSQSGLIQLFSGLEEAEQIAAQYGPDSKLAQFKNQQQLSEIAGVELTKGGLWLPRSGWLETEPLISALLDHSNIDLQLNSQVTRLEQTDGVWNTFDAQSEVLSQSPVLVMATGHSLTSLPETQWLPIKPIGGQITLLPETNESASLKTVLCEAGSMLPALKEQHVIGTTYHLDSNTVEVSEEDHEANLIKVQPMLKQKLEPNLSMLDGRAAIRAATPDYLPLVGSITDHSAFVERYQELSRDATLTSESAAPVLEGLYLIGGMGSRGYCYAPLCAELLASKISGEPNPVSRDMEKSLNPSRFLIRDVIRGKMTSQLNHSS